MSRAALKRPGGFALFEVLVSLVLVAVGLLGVAKMQVLALKGTQNSGKRTLVALSAASLGAVLHGNKAYWNSGMAKDVSVTIANGKAVITGVGAEPASQCASATSKCSAAELAAHDVRTWADNLLSQVPGFSGATIALRNTPAPVAATISVNWTEAYAAGNTVGVQAPSEQSYTLYVQP
jgi:type IV pilus assembly protein PilV